MAANTATGNSVIDVTDFVMDNIPRVYEELSNYVYDLDLLKKKGYSTKNGKVFAHAGSILAPTVREAFNKLGLKPRALRPGRIYMTDNRRNFTNKEKSIEISGLYFFTDSLSVEEER